MAYWIFSIEENYTGAYTAEMLALGGLRDVFQDGTIISDFEGLLGVQTTLAVIEVLGFPQHQFPKLSMEESLKILEQLSDMLTTWEPLRLTDPDVTLEQIWSLNLPNCFDILINSIENATNRLVNLFDQSQGWIGEGSYLLHLATINEQMERMRKSVRIAFSTYPFFPADESNEFHFNMVNFDQDAIIFLFTDDKLLQFFKSCGLSTFVVTVPVNSQIAAKIKQTTYSGLIRESTDTICPICREDLHGGQNLGFRIGCYHICCSHCLDTWLDTLMENDSELICASCRQLIVEWGQVTPDERWTINIAFQSTWWCISSV